MIFLPLAVSNAGMLERTFEYGADPPYGDGSLSVELAQYQLHVEERQGAQQQHHDVRD